MKGPNYFQAKFKKIFMKENYYWVIVGVALGLAIYLADKYLF